MQVYSYNLQINQKDGHDLIAPDTYWNATKEEIEEHAGGCGPGKIGDWFVPDTMIGESVFLACQIHDWMYYTGETKLDKKWSDLIFLINMASIINDGELLDKFRLRTVMTYYQFVSDMGGGAFENTNTKTTG